MKTGIERCGRSLPKALQVWDRLSLWALCVYAAECAVGCSGNWLMLGPISIRIVLFAVCFALTLPLVLYHLRDFLRHPMTWLLAAFFVWLAVSAVRGYSGGHSLSFLKADVTSFLPFLLYFGFVATIRDRERLDRVLTTVFYASLVLAAVTTALHFLLAYITPAGTNAINEFLNQHAFGGFSTMKAGGQRIYLRSQIFLQVAMLIGLYKIWRNKTRWYRLLLCIGEAVLLFACILTYTRGFWVGLFVSAVLFLGFGLAQWKCWLASLGAILAGLTVLIGLSWVAYQAPLVPLSVLERIAPSLVTERVTQGPGDPLEDAAQAGEVFEQSEALRDRTIEEQNKWIAQNPLFGHGLGKNLDGVREDGKTEYVYQDIWMKTGLIGLLLFMGVLLYYGGVQVARWLRWKAKRDLAPNTDAGVALMLLWCLLGMMVTSYFNPFLTSPMGATIWMLAAAGAEIAFCEPNGGLSVPVKS